MPDQIPLDFGHSLNYSAEDFLVAESNAEAHRCLLGWPSWPSFALCLWGPPGCGKSHLAHLFRARSGASLVAAAMLHGKDLVRLVEPAAVVVEDADRGVDETALLHLYNLLREHGRFLLLTGRQPPARWAVGLADLRSRLVATPVIAIGNPDDALIEAVLVKLFADRQVRVGPEVLSYLLPRIERSFHAVRSLVEALDAAAMAGQRPITVPLVREVMAGGGKV
jgi:DnaA regulatory inactivator Hda